MLINEFHGGTDQCCHVVTWDGWHYNNALFHTFRVQSFQVGLKFVCDMFISLYKRQMKI